MEGGSLLWGLIKFLQRHGSLWSWLHPGAALMLLSTMAKTFVLENEDLTIVFQNL